MALNVELLQKVRDRIAEIPESYDQSTWEANSDKSPCGSTHCLAGETIIAAAPSVKQGIRNLQRAVDRFHRSVGYDKGVVKKARTLLGISEAQALKMFDGEADGWPQPYKRKFQRLKTNKTKARVAVAYLDECLKRGKVTW